MSKRDLKGENISKVIVCTAPEHAAESVTLLSAFNPRRLFSTPLTAFKDGRFTSTVDLP